MCACSSHPTNVIQRPNPSHGSRDFIVCSHCTITSRCPLVVQEYFSKIDYFCSMNCFTEHKITSQKH